MSSQTSPIFAVSAADFASSRLAEIQICCERRAVEGVFLRDAPGFERAARPNLDREGDHLMVSFTSEHRSPLMSH